MVKAPHSFRVQVPKRKLRDRLKASTAVVDVFRES
jgi:hypothetical protein